MAEEPQVIRGIDWRQVFPFTHVFRAFRIAIHPSKLVLALLALLCLYFGGRILDALWTVHNRAVPGEISLYESSATPQAFLDARKAARAEVEDKGTNTLYRIEMAADQMREAEKKTKVNLSEDDARKLVKDQPGKAASQIVGTLKSVIPYEINKREADYEKDKKDYTAQQNEDRIKQLATERRRDYEEGAEVVQMADRLRGQGLFDAFLNAQTHQANNVVNAVLSNNWLGGISGSGPDGVCLSVYKFFTVAPTWALQYHWLYFILFGILFLCVWSLFGGAIARIAAVHVADEGRKLSVRQGLSFAVSKFLSFISAPMIPLIIVVVIGVIVAAGGLLLWIPYIGPIIAGGLFFLALAAGFVMTLVLLGTAGGFNLMYPTIAVEGSDSFDAISRSFSYVYAKPWRMLFYSAVAVAYGALTYLFVRMFIWVLLVVTSFFVGLFVYNHAANGAYVWPTMFPPPSFQSLPYEINTLPLDWGQTIGARLTEIWVYLLISMLGAFAISFYFSANTIIYYLMRREVDATEMDDVYLEQPEEEFAETPVAASTTATTEGAVTPPPAQPPMGTPTPPAEPPAGPATA